jgi:hypothetical protein
VSHSVKREKKANVEDETYNGTTINEALHRITWITMIV